MAKKSSDSKRRPAVIASILVTVCCCTIIVIALCVPLARAQLILSALPAPIAIAAAWSRPRRRG
jgi:hypothetical protein